jgi:hypothetical protein
MRCCERREKERERKCEVVFVGRHRRYPSVATRSLRQEASGKQWGRRADRGGKYTLTRRACDANSKQTYGHEAGNLVADALRGSLGHGGEEALVGVEVEGQLRVVLLDDLARRALDELVADATLAREKKGVARRES